MPEPIDPNLPASPDIVREIKFRKISSLDGSELFDSLEEKQSALRTPRPRIVIPEYGPTRRYRNNSLKRFYARARYFAAVVKQKLSGREYPVIAVLVVNNKCNWNCTYCFGDYPARKENDYTTDELKYLVDELYGLGVRYLNVHGGETLLRPDIGEICDYIKRKGMYLCVITNGSLLEKKIEAVRNVDNLTVSLDGAELGNDLNRGRGAFAATMKAIGIAHREKIPLRVQATLTKHTMNDVGYLAKLAHEKNFHLQFSILFKPLKKAREAQMSGEEIRASLREIRRYRDLGYPVFTSDRALRAAYEWPYDFNELHHITDSQITPAYRPHHIRCFYGRTKFTIEADGYVYPCFLTTDGSFRPKNWREDGVEGAIAHVREKNLCRACPALTHGDHNLLLGMDGRQILYLVRDQIKETFRLRNRPSVAD